MRVAAVDIGTNTVRLLIADTDDGGPAPREVLRRSAITGLGRGVDASGRFAPGPLAATLETLARYRALTAVHEVERIRAVATSASRDVADPSEFLDRAEEALGVRPEIIAGDVEAALSYRGATVGSPVSTPTTVLDVGGGSTEIIHGTREPMWSRSVDIGSVRLTDRLLDALPAGTSRVAAARAMAAEAFAAVRTPPGNGVGVGGTITTLAAMAAPDLPVAGRHMTAETVTGAVERLTDLSIDRIEAIAGVPAGRAPVILGGAIVVEAAMAAIGARSLVVSTRDLLDGIALDLSDRA